MSGARFPGFDVLDQAGEWDEETRAVVEGRLRRRPQLAFFSDSEAATCGALLACLLGLEAGDAGLPVLEQLDERLALGRTDGFRYAEMPPDVEAWRMSLRELDALAEGSGRQPFADLDRAEQEGLLRQVKGSECLGPLPVKRLWPLWLRYACAALYSLPQAWSEIGFGGPAYPRGYKNLGLDRREPWETADASPDSGRVERAGA